MWWRIVLVLLVLGGLTGFGLVYFDSVWSLVQNFWGLDDALRKKILDILTIFVQAIFLLVVCQCCIDGYSDFNFIRASAVVKRQFTNTAF